MATTSDERLFSEFRRYGDVDALATLFHRRADELLRLALFLSPRPSDAEDLLQATFLSAIARAETFRDGHRVMSWLCGILTNHARMLRRAERRQPPRTEPSRSPDPVGAAVQSELRTALNQSIARLREPYRSVLHLHLHDGLNSSEISQRLQRPPATVRKQMARAIEQLRRALPVGLATGLLLHMSPAQIAQRAAEAAQFVDRATDGDPAPLDDLPHGVPIGWSPAATAAAFAAPTLLALLAWVVWSEYSVSGITSSSPSPERTAIADSAAALASPALVVQEAAASRSQRSAAALGHALSFSARRPDGSPHPGIEVLCVPDDGTALPARLLRGPTHRTTTDDAGRGRFDHLPPGRYDLLAPGSLPCAGATISDGDVAKDLRLPEPIRVSGTVVDPQGRPIANAEVLASQTAGRGDLPTTIAHTDATGWFDASCLVRGGQLFARHPDYGQSVCQRLQADRRYQLQLEPRPAAVLACVRRPDGEAVADCVVALVPKSQNTNFFAPQFALTDAAGRCTLPGAGERCASVLALPSTLAPVQIDLPTNATEAVLELAAPVRLAGRCRAADGKPLAGRLLTVSAAGIRTNEPTGPLLARRVRLDADGRFDIRGLPPRKLVLRVLGEDQASTGPPMSSYVLAGLDVDARSGARDDLELVAPTRSHLRGSLHSAAGQPLAGWHVLAVPESGTAVHRMFRRRTATIRPDGSFSLPAVDATEGYQLGFYPPHAWWPYQVGWPAAFARGTAEDPLHVRIATDNPARANLRIQALGPDGRPSRRAAFELRHTALHAPHTTTADGSGIGRFTGLPAGTYWLALHAPGLGSRTLEVTIPPGSTDIDLGAMRMERPARTIVRCTTTEGAPAAQVRVVARPMVGDKYASARTDEKGTARMAPLAPGYTRLLCNGPDVAPTVLERQLEPGVQRLDVALRSAPTQTLAFTFQLADNPFVINGPLHVRLVDDAGRTVLDDYVGAVSRPGRFELRTGLMPGRYRVQARSLWNALASGELVVAQATAATHEFALRP